MPKFNTITKALPALALLGAISLATSTTPVSAAPTSSRGNAIVTQPGGQWWAQANREGNKAGVAGAVAGAVACAVGTPGALAGAVIGGAGGYVGGIVAYALFGVRGTAYLSAPPDSALNQ